MRRDSGGGRLRAATGPDGRVAESGSVGEKCTQLRMTVAAVEAGRRFLAG